MNGLLHIKLSVAALSILVVGTNNSKPCVAFKKFTANVNRTVCNEAFAFPSTLNSETL